MAVRTDARPAASVRVGTSGWHYRHWRGPFYPEDLSPRRMLPFYASHFDTVELNTTFYRLPPPGAAGAWRDATPPGFVFAAKGSRFITHMKKLGEPETALARYFDRIAALEARLGPVVFQLPPQWPLNLDRLAAFLAALPAGRYAFEFRNASWHVPPVYELLARHRAAYCIYDLAGFQAPLEVTTDFTYIRLHGPGGKYQGSYDERALGEWANRLRGWGLDAYVYFDNDEAGYAPRNALRLRELLDK
jgi:uncharacterized protein YecE (DUF72 family)